MLGACDREERGHEVHLRKGVYAGKPMTKLDEKQIAELQRRAGHGDYCEEPTCGIDEFSRPAGAPSRLRSC